MSLGNLRAWLPTSAILRRQALLSKYYIIDRLARRYYRSIEVKDILARRRSDIVFVFGTGASLLDLTPENWAAIARHDVMSFREFHRQNFIRADFHVSAEIDDVDDYARSLRGNPLYADCLYLVQEGINAEMGNQLIGRHLLPENAPVLRFRRKARGIYAPPSTDLRQGIVHGHGSICGVTNICLLLGWRRIVLCGVDLYDHRHFYMPLDQTRSYEKPGITFASRYASADRIVDMIGDWADLCRNDGREIYALNPKSLLTRRVPAFDLSTLHEAPHGNG
jgi:hypothetical protein